jgi:dihydrolipoamide dehydrogenase
VLEADKVLQAIGFAPRLEGYGLESLGVATERGAIVVDEYCRTNVEHVYAIGDVTANLMLAHVAEEKGYDVKTATFPFSANGKAQGLGEAVGFVKVVADAEYNEILGAHLIGPDVTELLPVLTLAQKWDLTADEVARNVFAHPTLTEAVKEAVHGIAGHMVNL